MTKFSKLIAAGSVVAAGLSASVAIAGHGDTLAAVKERGTFNCTGHNGSYLGLAEVDANGNWKGFDIDVCRAVATAIFGTHEGHVSFVPTSWAQRWPALQSGEIDAVIKATGWTIGRDGELGFQFSNAYLLAPTKVLVRKELGATTVADLDGGSVCVPAGTAQEVAMAGYLERIGTTMEFVVSEKTEESEAAYLSGRCDAFVQWDVQLATLRLKAENPDDHMILSDSIAAEPVAAVVRQGDDNWVDIINFTLSTLVAAEEAGVTSANVDEMRANPPSPSVGMMLGVTPGYGSGVGLSDDFGYNIIKTLGNYSEIWERNLGMDSPYKLERGVNALWQNGGVLWPLLIH
ncbi:amino acid ABC transporter substrate-binding protein [Xinfangfangia sp. CPCC 101601]|uniref:Amino acid ABC transporter substrate-binding protein n=1 Tax=Pseudogemmobacter lacusdianii TaxID=3069608 RepID=A0ABU0W285_9RHOB|nr:amino acid ABC transporter substrate-binding protein [Xinfangfangia sp. CPCC 101601]MDQ2068119.1 amino acid ABC transporter substrate-binding protein [Xinfangfangia sp. CPCC 101601]